MERKLNFTPSPYVVGKVRVAHQASKRFQQCDEEMRRITSLNPNSNLAVIKVEGLRVSSVGVTKEMIFGMYLIKEAALNDLRDAGASKLAEGIAEMFKTKIRPPVLAKPVEVVYPKLEPQDFPKGIPQAPL